MGSEVLIEGRDSDGRMRENASRISYVDREVLVSGAEGILATYTN